MLSINSIKIHSKVVTRTREKTVVVAHANKTRNPFLILFSMLLGTTLDITAFLNLFKQVKE